MKTKANKVLNRHYARLNNLKSGFSFSDQFVKSVWVGAQDIVEAFLEIGVLDEKEARKWSMKLLNRYHKVLIHNDEERRNRVQNKSPL